jgi:hypothetical protein
MEAQFEASRSTEEECAAMKLGMKYIEFQHYYLVVIVTQKSSPNSPNLCLHASRKALELLPELVSHSMDVYNGIIW